MFLRQHLRIYHKNHLSFKELQSATIYTYIRSLFDVAKERLYYSVITELIVELGVKRKSSEVEVKEQFESLLLLFSVDLQGKFQESLDDLIVEEEKNHILKEFLEAYYKDDYVQRFRGDFLEYVTMWFYRQPSYSMYHEPVFRHKRRALVPKSVPGFQCLVDVVALRADYKDIKLVECKSNINNFLKGVKNNKSVYKNPNKRKISYMNYLGDKLEDYMVSRENHSAPNVEKHLITIISPQESNESYQDFKIVDLKTELRNL